MKICSKLGNCFPNHIFWCFRCLSVCVFCFFRRIMFFIQKLLFIIRLSRLEAKQYIFQFIPHKAIFYISSKYVGRVATCHPSLVALRAKTTCYRTLIFHTHTFQVHSFIHPVIQVCFITMKYLNFTIWNFLTCRSLSFSAFYKMYKMRYCIRTMLVLDKL